MQKIITLPLFLLSLTAAAQDDAKNNAELPELLVTATRSETAANQLAVATTVYNRQDIQQLQVKSVPELFRTTLGIDLTQSGGMGTVSSLFMRGTNSDHVLVLIDGIKVGSATLGTSPYELMPIDQIERIEIIRGPQSSLYGSEAIGGVIQIFTRKGANTETPKVNLDAGGGSYNTYRASGSLSGQWQNTWYTLGASSLGTDGINAREPIPGPYGFSHPDRDGYQNIAMNAKLGHRFDNNAEIEASFMRTQGTTDYDSGFGGNHSEFINQVISLSAKMRVLDNWSSSLRLGQSRDDSDSFLADETFYSRFNTTRWNASWLNEISVTDSDKFILGSDYRVDEVDSSTRYTENSRYDVGVFGEYRGQFWQRHFLTASLRWDKNQAFGDYVTGNIGWRSDWEFGLSTFANFGNAFKAPSFNDLYFPDYGNPSLQPEEATSVEAGVAGNHDWLKWELRAYHTDIRNLISPVADANYNYTAQNVGKAQIDGLEAQLNTQLFGWNAKLNLNWLSPRNRESNLRLLRRTNKSLSFDLSRSFGQFDVGGSVLAQGNRFDNASNTVKVAGYATVDLRAAYHITDNWMISANLRNLLDKDYQTVNTYNTQGRNFFFMIHYTN